MSKGESLISSSLHQKFPYRLALAGGWIDQPFVSQYNPRPPGSMVVVSLNPTYSFMDRCGMATSTRQAAERLWKDGIPRLDAQILMRELYAEENRDKPSPSGSQDMAGLIYPGITRLDYDYDVDGGVFPASVESLLDDEHVRWLETHIHLVPVAPRPEGYDPLIEKHLDPRWIERLGQSGKNCFRAIQSMDIAALGDSLNECMRCWEALLPGTVRHPLIALDLKQILQSYQQKYAGAMYSGCGGGYLIVVSDACIPGSIQLSIRTKNPPFFD